MSLAQKEGRKGKSESFESSGPLRRRGRDPPYRPPMISPPEEDAIKILYISGKVEDTRRRSTEVANIAMEQAQFAAAQAQAAAGQ